MVQLLTPACFRFHGDVGSGLKQMSSFIKHHVRVQGLGSSRLSASLKMCWGLGSLGSLGFRLHQTMRLKIDVGHEGL